MNVIVDFLTGIGQAITSGFSLVFGLLEDLVYLILLTGKVLLSIPTYFSWLPPQFVVLVVSILTIAVLYKVMGRE